MDTIEYTFRSHSFFSDYPKFYLNFKIHDFDFSDDAEERLDKLKRIEHSGMQNYKFKDWLIFKIAIGIEFEKKKNFYKAIEYIEDAFKKAYERKKYYIYSELLEPIIELSLKAGLLEKSREYTTLYLKILKDRKNAKKGIEIINSHHSDTLVEKFKKLEFVIMKGSPGETREILEDLILNQNKLKHKIQDRDNYSVWLFKEIENYFLLRPNLKNWIPEYEELRHINNLKEIRSFRNTEGHGIRKSYIERLAFSIVLFPFYLPFYLIQMEYFIIMKNWPKANEYLKFCKRNIKKKKFEKAERIRKALKTKEKEIKQNLESYDETHLFKYDTEKTEITKILKKNDIKDEDFMGGDRKGKREGQYQLDKVIRNIKYFSAKKDSARLRVELVRLERIDPNNSLVLENKNKITHKLDEVTSPGKVFGWLAGFFKKNKNIEKIHEDEEMLQLKSRVETIIKKSIQEDIKLDYLDSKEDMVIAFLEMGLGNAALSLLEKMEMGISENRELIQIHYLKAISHMEVGEVFSSLKQVHRTLENMPLTEDEKVCFKHLEAAAYHKLGKKKKAEKIIKDMNRKSGSCRNV